MPLYVWLEKKSGKTIDILRSFDDYQVPPTEDEALGAGLNEEEVGEAEWEKRLGTGIQVIRGDSWGGSKGNWGK